MKSFEIINTGSATAAALSVGGTALPTLGGKELVVFPNPTDVELNIQFGRADQPISALRIYDVMGKVHLHLADANTLQGNGMTLPIQHLPQGVYLLQVQRQDQIQTVRFIKK